MLVGSPQLMARKRLVLTASISAAALALVFATAAIGLVPTITGLSSPTHAYSSTWYADDSPGFTWGGFPSLLGAVDTPGTATRVAISGDAAYVADDTGGLAVLSISSPTTPTLLGSYAFCCPAKDIAVDGQTVYVANGSHGLVIMDVSDKSNPAPIASLDSPGEALGIATYGHVTFVADGSAGLRSIDTSHPADPQLLDTIDTTGTASDVALAGSIAYVANGDSGLVAIDISNASALVTLGSFDTSGSAVAVAVAGDVAFVADSAGGMVAVDITDPENLALSSVTATPDDAEDIYALGDLAYVAAGDAGLVVVDITDPGRPIIIGTQETNDSARGVAAAGGVAYIADGQSGLTTLRVVETHTPPTLLGSYAAWADCLVVRGDVLYVATWDYLQMLDISDPTSPTVVGWIATNPAYMIDVSGDILYMASGYSGMILYDVSDPTNPVQVGSYNTPGYASRISVVGDIAYVADYTSGLQVIDVSDPTAPSFLGSYNTPGYARGVAVSEGVAYVADWGSGLQCIDVSDPTALSLLGTYNTPGSAFEVVISGEVAYVSDWNSGMRMVDISDPASPTSLGVFPTAGAAAGVAVDGDTAYVSRIGGLDMVDVSDPTTPAGIGMYAQPGWSYHAAVAGDVVYVGTETNVHALQVGDYPAGYATLLDQVPASIPDTSSAMPGQTAEYSGVASGEWYFHVRPVGRFGTTGETSHMTVRVDTTPPMTTDNAAPSYVALASIEMTAADLHSGVAQTFFRLDGGDTQTGTVATSIDLGTHTLEYWSRDIAGNVEAPNVVEFEVVSGSTNYYNIEGTNRYSTSVAASQEAYADGADTVIVATGRNWPDALAGGALAGTYDAPILLVDTTRVPAEVSAEIARLGATNVIILGGTSAVSSEVAEKFLASKMTVSRIGGTNRYDTANLIADRVMAQLGNAYDGVAFAATGADFPDALAATPIAAARRWPIYLVSPSAGAPISRMQGNGVDEVLVLGGQKAVSSAHFNGLAAAFGSGNVARIEGADRYATSIEVATFGADEAGLGWNWLAFATGQDFPDGLTGGLVPSRKDSVLLLVKTNELPGSVSSALEEQAPWISDAYFLGGPAAISPTVRAQIAAVLR